MEISNSVRKYYSIKRRPKPFRNFNVNRPLGITKSPLNDTQQLKRHQFYSTAIEFFKPITPKTPIRRLKTTFANMLRRRNQRKPQTFPNFYGRPLGGATRPSSNHQRLPWLSAPVCTPIPYFTNSIETRTATRN